eukprot:TRINITY_DN18699_c0_g1_i1.p1 TRINITY_DN18699_c0_g1~~TRINITY_DN18699_c0_g1_i1.p1  ORF type:complete len:271 (+),score=35.12 TRINITY_DN18699_c0_g1_i1:57-869(+)
MQEQSPTLQYQHRNSKLKVESFLQSHNVSNGILLFACYFNDEIFNILPPSKESQTREGYYAGVFAYPTESWMGLSTPRDLHRGTFTTSASESSPSFRVYEIYNFCHLLLDGASVFEWLFVDHGPLYESDVWISLKSQRDTFLNCNSVGKVLGYAITNLPFEFKDKKKKKKWDNNYQQKMPHHEMLRLIGIAEEIVTTGTYSAWIVEGPHRENILSIVRNEREVEQVFAEARERAANLKAQKWETHLPDNITPQVRAFLGQWLVKLRIHNI